LIGAAGLSKNLTDSPIVRLSTRARAWPHALPLIVGGRMARRPCLDSKWMNTRKMP